MQLALQQVTVKFGPTVALREVTHVFTLGTRLQVVGPSGGGKSVLLKCLAGLQRPTSGSVEWNGRDAASFSPAERRVAQASLGFIFQSDALFDSMSVEDNVALPLTRRGVAVDEALERARRTLTRVQIDPRAFTRAPEALSGGMKKRVGIARAVVAQPTVLLADDPFAGLDPATERDIAQLLLEVSAGATLLTALPEPVEALAALPVFTMTAGTLHPEAP